MGENPPLRLRPQIPPCTPEPQIRVPHRCFTFWTDARGSGSFFDFPGPLLHRFRVREALWITSEKMAWG